MILAVKKVSITITDKEAISILNALNYGLDSGMAEVTPDNKPAYDLKSLLVSNFGSTIVGVHKL